MNNNKVIFATDLRPRPVRLLAIWLLLIVAPMLFFDLAANRILSMGEVLVKEKSKAAMLQELSNFRDDLSFLRLAEKKAQLFARQVNPGSMTAQQFAEAFRKNAEFDVAAVFALNRSSDDFSYMVAESIKDEIGMISRTILKNYLVFLLESFSNGPVVKSATGNNRRQVGINRGASHLRSLFTAAGKIILAPDRVVPAISGKESLGRLLIYYHPGSESSSSFILVIRERDISLSQLLSYARQNLMHNYLLRDYSWSTGGRRAVYQPEKSTIDFQQQNDGSICVLGLSSQEHLVNLVGKGTLFPFMIEETMSRMPLLKVTAPVEALQHPLRQIFLQTRMPGLIAFLIISILLLRMSFFGYGSNIRIRLRLFLAVIGASALPFSIFIASTIYHRHFQQEFSRSEINQYIQMQVDQISKSIYSHLNSKELLISALSEVLGQSNVDAPAYLQQWIKQNSASIAVYSDNSQELTLTSKPEEELESLEKDAIAITFLSMREALQQPATAGDEDLLGMVKLKSKGLGLILENTGMLHNSLTGGLDRVYAVFPIFRDNLRLNSPSALVFMKFKNRDTITNFLGLQPELLENEQRDNYVIQRCFVPISLPGELPAQSTFLTTPEFETDEVLSILEKTARSRSASAWSDDKSIIIATYLQKLNCVLLIRAQKLPELSSALFPWYLQVATYFILLVAAMILLLGNVLVQPINLLKTASEKITAGDYAHQIEFKSGDEFEPLTEAFNSMTSGLRQKELLASYVSDTVMQEIVANSGMKLSPGGERIEICVLFCSLAGFKEASKKSSATQVTTALSRLIDTVDSLAAENGGVMDKLIEDTAMLVFRQTGDNSDHVVSACRAALQISAQFPQPDCPFHANIGIASGPAVSGKIGSAEGKLDFTVIGNPVNLAARLKMQAGKALNTGIIACPNTIRLLKGRGRLGFIERTEIKGRSRTFPLYELLEMR